MSKLWNDLFYKENSGYAHVTETRQLQWFSMFGLLLHMSHKGGFKKAHDKYAQTSVKRVGPRSGGSDEAG